MSILINDPITGAIISEILEELASSKTKHPNYPTDTLRREAIIIEEALEAIRELINRVMHLQQVTLGVTRISAKDNYSRDDLRKELIQTAAMCVKMLESMEEESNTALRSDLKGVR